MHFIGFLGIISELMCTEYLEQCLACGELCTRVHYCYLTSTTSYISKLWAMGPEDEVICDANN